MVSDLFSCINKRWGEEMALKGKKIAVYVTGGIASYKVASFVRLLIKAKAEVRVAMTAAATSFISPLTMATLSKNPVLTNLVMLNNVAILFRILKLRDGQTFRSSFRPRQISLGKWQMELLMTSSHLR